MSKSSVTNILHQALLGDAWDHAAVPIVVFDDGRNFVAMNEAFCAFTGYSRDEIVKLRAGQSLAGDEGTLSAFDSIVRESAGSGFGSGRMRRKNGEILEVVWLTIQAEIARMPYFIGMVWRAEDLPFSIMS